jgi:hypothetical protein
MSRGDRHARRRHRAPAAPPLSAPSATLRSLRFAAGASWRANGGGQTGGTLLKASAVVRAIGPITGQVLSQPWWIKTRIGRRAGHAVDISLSGQVWREGVLSSGGLSNKSIWQCSAAVLKSLSLGRRGPTPHPPDSRCALSIPAFGHRTVVSRSPSRLDPRERVMLTLGRLGLECSERGKACLDLDSRSILKADERTRLALRAVACKRVVSGPGPLPNTCSSRRFAARGSGTSQSRRGSRG